MTESTSLNLFHLIVVPAVTVVGLMGNGFIMIANCLEWIRNKTLSASDMILLALSVFRLLFLGTTLGIYSFSLRDVSRPRPVPGFIVFLWSFLNAVSLWVATCLAVLYCMKIVNFTQPLLVKMKLRISGMIPQLLLGSVLASLLVSLPYIWLDPRYHYCNVTKGLLNNSNGTCPSILYSEFSAIVYITGTSPSFLIFLVSSALLIHSLLQHVKKMKRNAEGLRDQRMDIHMNAIKNLISFLILYSANYAAEIIVTLFGSPWMTVIAIVMVSTYHSGHPLILIAMNSKLKEALLKTQSHCLSKTTSSPEISKETGCS
ncbi:taste receptor type 2 member 4-like [Tiliqua scincoides]|uniref:taste receptor type 2 member 4-like n=1 Tax=Tiliqua scincoides TaxID=71010 RepID=UPI0034629917